MYLFNSFSESSVSPSTVSVTCRMAVVTPVCFPVVPSLSSLLLSATPLRVFSLILLTVAFEVAVSQPNHLMVTLPPRGEWHDAGAAKTLTYPELVIQGVKCSTPAARSNSACNMYGCFYYLYYAYGISNNALFISTVDDSAATEVSSAVLDALEDSVSADAGATEHTVIIMTDPAAPHLLDIATHLSRQVYQSPSWESDSLGHTSL